MEIKYKRQAKDPGKWSGKQTTFPKGSPKNKWEPHNKAPINKKGTVQYIEDGWTEWEGAKYFSPIEKSKRHFQFGMKMSESTPQKFAVYMKGKRKVFDRESCQELIENRKLPYWGEELEFKLEEIIPITIRPIGGR